MSLIQKSDNEYQLNFISSLDVEQNKNKGDKLMFCYAKSREAMTRATVEYHTLNKELAESEQRLQDIYEEQRAKLQMHGKCQ